MGRHSTLLNRSWLAAALLVVLISPVVSLAQSSATQKTDETEKTDRPNKADKSDVFTADAASRLLENIRFGLEGHDPRKMLSVFDIAAMKGGAVFRDRIAAFFDQYESFRVHFNLVEASMQGAEGVVVVEAELDATPTSSLAPPVRKRVQLRFLAANRGSGWKFTDVQPRSFFS
ncbi:MAG TPA: hypothetical protein VKZ53_10675 [Candidatus Angelobacter sp.]|nr:hypothetical protein [Candidatus Angelobacter sp.]